VGIERCAAHEHAVELALGEQLGGVLDVHAAAVQHARRRCAARTEPGPNLAMHRGRVLRSGVAPRTDRPHRFVRDHHARQGAAVEAAEPACQLARHHRRRVTRFPLGQRVPHAQQRREAARERGRDFATGVVVRLAKQLASLRVPDERRLGAGLQGEWCGDGAGKRPLRLPVDVLGTHQQIAALADRLRGGFERNGGSEEPDVAVVAPVVAGPEGLEVGAGLLRPEMHLPIGREEDASHASSSAATPGSGFPSRNSSAAPPPVETCVSLSSKPATAAAESPPPTTVVAPRFPASTMASAIARVPASNGGVSNTPIGPFQKTDAIARVPASNGGVSNTPIGPFQKTVFALTMRARKSSRVASSMSKMAQSAGMRSLDTARRSAARARLGATTAPRGRISFAPARAIKLCATSSLSRSTREPPTWNPMARKNVLAIAPPTRISSTRGSSAWITSILPEILAPPSTATKGRRGVASASPR